MHDTLTVLGLDAVDYRLAQRWNRENLRSDNHQEIKTFSYSLDIPATLEVWPSIATGQTPQEHGVVLNQIGWGNTSGLTFLVKFAQLLPETAHSLLSRLKEYQFGSSVQQTTMGNVFDEGSVYNWSGLTPCSDWNREGEWFAEVTAEDPSEAEFQRRHLGNAGKDVGWLAGQALVGVL